MNRQQLMWIAWPSFLAACVLEVLVFAFVDPHDLLWGGHAFDLSRQGVYSIAFFASQITPVDMSHPFSAVQYVSKNRSESVLFAFRTHMPPPARLAPLYLRGLDPDSRYEVEGIAGARSGSAWMHGGLELELEDFSSTVRRIRRV